MAWVKIDDQFTDHPKVVAAGPLAGWLYVCGLTYCSRYLTDGFIPEAQIRRMADIKNPAACASRLVDAGLWIRVDGGYHVHDYLEYQPSAEKVRADRSAAQERMKRVRSQDVRPNKERTSHSPSRPTPVLSTTPNGVSDISAGRKKQKTTWPEDFSLTDERWAVAVSAGVDPEATWERFKDWAAANGRAYVDWDAAWRNWAKSPLQQSRAPNGNGRRVSVDEQNAASFDLVRAAIRAKAAEQRDQADVIDVTGRTKP